MSMSLSIHPLNMLSQGLSHPQILPPSLIHQQDHFKTSRYKR